MAESSPAPHDPNPTDSSSVLPETTPNSPPNNISQSNNSDAAAQSTPPPNPNPNPTTTNTPPSITQPLIPPIAPMVPSFRPVQPQFTPVGVQQYQIQGAPPPGVTLQQQPNVMPMMPVPPGGGMYQMQQGQVQSPMVMRTPYGAMGNSYMGPVGGPPGSMTMPMHPPGMVRYPYPAMVRPPFTSRPPGVFPMVPPQSRPMVPGFRPQIFPSVVRPTITPIVIEEKPHTKAYVGKIATVENEFMLPLLELCGPVKDWKRAQDPTTGALKGFGFCEFESAEGVLRALRLLNKLNVDGQELMLNIDIATKEYLERYIEKKRENGVKTDEGEKDGESAVDEEKDRAKDDKKGLSVMMNGTSQPSEQESKKDDNQSEKDNDMAHFGLVTDEDRETDNQVREKIANLIEERLRTKPLPPPPPPPLPPRGEGRSNSNLDVPAKSGDRESDADTMKKDEKNDGETSSDTRAPSRAGTESPDRGGRYDNRTRERDRDRDLKREKEMELERMERDRERDRARREKTRELQVQRAEKEYERRVREWEAREKEKEKERRREKEREKEREREKRRLIADEVDESGDDSRKRKRRSEIEDKRKKRRREKEDDMEDRLKEEEEIAEAKKRDEEQRQRQLEEAQKQQASALTANAAHRSPSSEVVFEEIKEKDAEKSHMTDANHRIHNGILSIPCSPVLFLGIFCYVNLCFLIDYTSLLIASWPFLLLGDVAENGGKDESIATSCATNDARPMGNIQNKRLGFGLVGSGKRAAVLSVFEEEEDGSHKEKKMRPLVPIDYSTEELQAVHTTADGSAPPGVPTAAEITKPKEDRADGERERNRRSHDRSSHRERNDGDNHRSKDDSREQSSDHGRDRERGSKNADGRKVLDAKQLIDMIPRTKDELFSYDINWTVYDRHDIHEILRPWISKKIVEFLGEEENTLVDYIVSSTQKHVGAPEMLQLLESILDEEAEMFVLKMWRMLIFEIKKVETGLAARPRA
ncbi:RNA-binding motif protein 25-like protein [Drosera capensis]